MKKFLALMLALIMVCSMTACSDSVGEAVDQVVQEKADVLAIGTVTGDRYENTYFGIICELDSSWTYASKEELAAAVSMTAEQMDISATLEQTDYYMDMAANCTDTGASINVGVEKPNMSMTAEQYCQQSVDMIPEQMATIGFTVDVCEVTTVQVGGRQVDGVVVEGTIEGVSMYETLAVLERDGRFAIITVSALDQAEIENILSKISLY